MNNYQTIPLREIVVSISFSQILFPSKYELPSKKHIKSYKILEIVVCFVKLLCQIEPLVSPKYAR